MLIAVRPKACPSCQPAYGPLVMLDPRPGRPPAKAAPPTSIGHGNVATAQVKAVYQTCSNEAITEGFRDRIASDQ